MWAAYAAEMLVVQASLQALVGLFTGIRSSFYRHSLVSSHMSPHRRLFTEVSLQRCSACVRRVYTAEMLSGGLRNGLISRLGLCNFRFTCAVTCFSADIRRLFGKQLHTLQVHKHIYTNTHTHTHTHINIYIYQASLVAPGQLLV